MSEPLNEQQLQRLERPTYNRRTDIDNVLDERAAAEIRKLRERVADLENTSRTASKRIVDQRDDNACLRVELAVAQEILLQERELLRLEIAKLRDYVQHNNDCQSRVGCSLCGHGECDCGLDPALKQDDGDR